MVARASGMDLASSLKRNTFLTLGVRPVGGPGSGRDGGTRGPPRTGGHGGAPDGGKRGRPRMGGHRGPPDGGTREGPRDFLWGGPKIRENALRLFMGGTSKIALLLFMGGDLMLGGCYLTWGGDLPIKD